MAMPTRVAICRPVGLAALLALALAARHVVRHLARLLVALVLLEAPHQPLLPLAHRGGKLKQGLVGPRGRCVDH